MPRLIGPQCLRSTKQKDFWFHRSPDSLNETFVNLRSSFDPWTFDSNSLDSKNGDVCDTA